MNELGTFPDFSRLKPNKTKCDNAVIDVLNGVQVALCGMNCVNLNNETLKILGVDFSYNKNLEQEKSFCEHIIKIEGRITVFKSLAASKVMHLFLITNLHNGTIDLLY